MSHPCEFDGCAATETSVFVYHGFDEGDDVATWLCWEHAGKMGFCPSCGDFVAGVEDDDRALGRHGICAACLEALWEETGEPDHDDDWDY